MKVTNYANAEAFLNCAQPALEANEAANSLMLGLCLTCKQHPERIKKPAYFGTVEDDNGLVLSGTMTPPHELILVSHQDNWEQAVQTLADHLNREGVHIPGSFGPKHVALGFAQAWSALTGQAYRLKSAERVWELREAQMPTPQHGHLRPSAESEAELLATWWRGFYMDIWGNNGPVDTENIVARRIQDEKLYVWDVNGKPVSMAIKTRPVQHGISVSMVYTPPKLRGKGYATACVGELSRLLLDSGWEYCSLFTDLANPVSNHIYEKIGYRPVCDYDKYTLKKPLSIPIDLENLEHESQPEKINWSVFPANEWHMRDREVSALRKLAQLRDKSSFNSVYNQVLYAFGNNHKGTLFPSVIVGVNFILDIALNGKFELARNCALDILTDLLACFDAEPGFEVVQFENGQIYWLRETVVKKIKNMLPLFKLLTESDKILPENQKVIKQLIDWFGDETEVD